MMIELAVFWPESRGPGGVILKAQWRGNQDGAETTPSRRGHALGRTRARVGNRSAWGVGSEEESRTRGFATPVCAGCALVDGLVGPEIGRGTGVVKSRKNSRRRRSSDRTQSYKQPYWLLQTNQLDRLTPGHRMGLTVSSPARAARAPHAPSPPPASARAPDRSGARGSAGTPEPRRPCRR